MTDFDTDVSARAKVITRRTYNRPLNDEGTVFETWDQTVSRVIQHQKWLWERAQGRDLDRDQRSELNELMELLLFRKASTSGRTLWLGGTPLSQKREASQFNCAFGRAETVHDIVDFFWLLLQGCGVGFEPVVGTLSGFTKPAKISTIRSQRTIEEWENGERGEDANVAVTEGSVYILSIGDSAEAWAKSVGKLLALKEPVSRIVLDFSQIRAAGIRLKGYGWISSGDETFAKALEAICQLLNKRAGQLLTRMDILDIMNWLGTTLSSRRSAEIAVVPFSDPEALTFASAKKDYWIDNLQREQSNNSLLFYQRPSKLELRGLFDLMAKAGGSEPGFINAEAALKRAPWFKGVNPCAEILLGNKSFCNLVEVDLGKFNGDTPGLTRALWVAARANYRQTCVNLDDGILQRSWHELNEFLRLCGVGITGIARWDWMKSPSMAPGALQAIRQAAVNGANTMADELGLPRPKAVTTVKPSGTLGKIMDTTEGAHKPLGRCVFNNVNFSKHDRLIPILKEAGYRVFDHPTSPDGVLVTFPVSYDDVDFEDVELEDGRVVQVNRESAVEQLERYKLLMDNYVDHNCSITISYSLDEVPDIVDWIFNNWDCYVGVSFLYRNDPTKTAADLGFLYLPQEVKSKEEFDEYVQQLKPFDVNKGNDHAELSDEGCATGACPIR